MVLNSKQHRAWLKTAGSKAKIKNILPVFAEMYDMSEFMAAYYSQLTQAHVWKKEV